MAETLRERWVKTMSFQKPDRIPLMEFGYWDETLPTWHAQGLPETVQTEADAYAYFGIEDWQKSGVNSGVCPAFQEELIEHGPDYVIMRDKHGAVRKEIRTGMRSIPQYLEYGIKNRADWQRFKERLDPRTPGRYPADWAQRVEAWRTRDYPLSINIGSMLGTPRNWIGFENIGLLAYDDPELLDEIIETCCDCVCETIKPALEQVQFDFGAGWEDVCFKNGPIISPKMFERFVVPRYKRITDLLHAHGVNIIWTDCDGNILPILDQFLDGGINCMFPLEVAGGSDPVAIRQKYGRRVLLHGGVNKLQLRLGFKEIEAEMKRLLPLVEEGGFVPHVDHRCPSDVSLENYKFYLKLKREMFGAGDLKPQYKE